MWNKFLEWNKYVNHNWFGGNEGETISSRLGRNIKYRNCWPCRIFCRTVLLPLGILIDKDFKHCRKSIQEEYEKKSG